MTKAEPEEIIGIRHLVGLGWIGAFMNWSPLFRLPVIIVLSMSMIVSPWLLGANLQSVVVLLVSIMMCGASLAVLVILARGAEADMREAGATEFLEELAPSTQQAALEKWLGLFAGLFVVSYFGFLFDDNAVLWMKIFQPEFYGSAGTGVILREWLLTSALVVSTVLTGHIVGFSYRQIKLFTRWADTADVDLLHIDDYQVYTLQPMRYLLITVIFASLNILAYQVMTYSESEEQVLLALAPIVSVMLLSVIAFIKPVAAIRDRIHQKKMLEIEAIRSALGGQREALKNAQIAPVAHEFATPDLMMYEQYIRNIWEWPIQGYVQRILLYVLLPPLAWVLAALVERMVDGLL